MDMEEEIKLLKIEIARFKAKSWNTWLSLDEVTAIYGYSKPTIYKLKSKGKITTRQAGRMQVRASSIEQYVNSSIWRSNYEILAGDIDAEDPIALLVRIKRLEKSLESLRLRFDAAKRGK